ncbi:hypothetical protein [Capnocytophaga stomatis]|uniref:DUF2752 domain-containing protein n=1 Tax=Capnocytophaga stomatis TaxID=1848904 RepID=A0ABW8Q8A2_9FLAO
MIKTQITQGLPLTLNITPANQKNMAVLLIAMGVFVVISKIIPLKSCPCGGAFS